MNHEILYRPSHSLLKVNLDKGESISAEAGAMVSMSSTIEIETNAGEVCLAPSLPVDLTAVELANQTILAQSGAYVASSPEITVDTKWGGAKTFVSREGFFLLKIAGTDTVFLSSYGAIHEVQLVAGQKHTVDTGHMVAFNDSVRYEVKRVDGLKSTLFLGEGLVCELTGPGRIML